MLKGKQVIPVLYLLAKMSLKCHTRCSHSMHASEERKECTYNTTHRSMLRTQSSDKSQPGRHQKNQTKDKE